MKKFLNLLAIAAVGATMSVKAVAAEEVIRAVHAFPGFLVYTKTFLSYVDEVNARGKGVVRIQVMGGPEAIKMFEQPNAVRDGVVDMVLPVVVVPARLHPLKVSIRAAAEQRVESFGGEGCGTAATRGEYSEQDGGVASGH